MAITNPPTLGADPQTINSSVLNGMISPLVTDYNGNIDDTNIATSAGIKSSKLDLTAINQSVKNSGTTELAGVTKMTSAAFNQAKCADIASATTTTIWATDGNYAHITGTTTITSFGTAPQAGAERTIVFDGALTLTHNSTSLILPGGANITTAAGDRAIVRAETTANARVISYVKADGTAVVVSGGTATNLVGASFRNLAVVKASASTVTATADVLVVNDTSNGTATITSYNKTADITASGAGGLDTGTEAANTIYYIWAIRKSSDGTNNILLSTSSSSPTMPSGYDQKALLSAVGNDNSSNFIAFHQTGRRYSFDVWATLATGTIGTWSGTYASVALNPANMTTVAGFVPSGLSNYCYGSFAAAVGAVNMAVANLSTVTGDGNTLVNNRYMNNGGTLRWELDVLTANTLYFMSSGSANLYLHGFEITKLA